MKSSAIDGSPIIKHSVGQCSECSSTLTSGQDFSITMPRSHNLDLQIFDKRDMTVDLGLKVTYLVAESTIDAYVHIHLRIWETKAIPHHLYSIMRAYSHTGCASATS